MQKACVEKKHLSKKCKQVLDSQSQRLVPCQLRLLLSAGKKVQSELILSQLAFVDLVSDDSLRNVTVENQISCGVGLFYQLD